MIIIKTENNNMLCSFETIMIRENNNSNSFIKRFVLDGVLPSKTKILLASFDTLLEAQGVLNDIYANIPNAISLSPLDIPQVKMEEPYATR